METKGNNIDNLFKEILLEHEVSPPKEVWTNISEQIKKKKSKKLIVLWYRIAAGVTILLASAWFISRNIINEKNIPTLTENNQLIDEEKPNRNVTHESIEAQTLLSQEQNKNNHQEKNNINTNTSVSKIINTNKNKTLPVAQQTKTSNQKGIFRIKNENEQFVIPNQNTTKHNDNNSIEKLAMLDINLEMEIPEEQLIYDKTEVIIINAKINKGNQWEVGGYYAPLYSYRALEMGNKDLDANSMMSNSEQGQYTYSGGFSVNYKITRRLSIGSGLSIVNHSYKVSNVASLTTLSNLAYFADGRSNKTSNQSYSVNNSIGQITTTSGDVKSYSSPNFDKAMLIGESQAINNSYALPDNQTINQSFDYMEIPVFLRFKIIDRNIGLHLVSGLSSYFLVNNKVTIKSPDQPDITGKTLDIKTTNLSGSLGMGLNYTLAQNLKLNMEPIFKIFLNSINISNSTNVYPYSFGIYSGISYSF